MSDIRPELVSAPLTLFLSPVGTAFPTVDEAPGSFSDDWVLLGSNGDLNYDSTGITATHNTTKATFTPVGSTVPTKVWTTDEGLELAVVLADLSPDQYAIALNDAEVATIAATSEVCGEMDIPLMQGGHVALFALLARGISSIDSTLNCQYAVPVVYQSANPAPVFKKGAPGELSLTWATLLDPAGGGQGELQIQTAAKT